jgi:AcrR family transcriptional regulator
VRSKTVAVEERMLDAAAQLFGTQRFHEVRMEDIAAQADVGKGTLYRYFKDKEELYLALVSRSARQFTNRLQEEIRRVAEPRAQLRRVIAAIVNFFDDQPHLFDLIQRAEVLQGPGFPWRETREELIRTVTALFRNGKERGDFAVSDPELTALLLLGGVRTIIRFGNKPRPADLAEQILNVFLQDSINPAKPRKIRPALV